MQYMSVNQSHNNKPSQVRSTITDSRKTSNISGSFYASENKELAK